MSNETLENQTPEFIVDAYQTVETMLKDAVGGAKSHEEFVRNLYYCQTVSQRMLALLIYNASVNGNPGQELERSAQMRDQQLKRVVDGIKHEIDLIVESSKDEKNMEKVECALPLEQGKTNAH